MIEENKLYLNLVIVFFLFCSVLIVNCQLSIVN